jgi:hypothetical protein
LIILVNRNQSHTVAGFGRLPSLVSQLLSAARVAMVRDPDVDACPLYQRWLLMAKAVRLLDAATFA